MKTSCKAQLKWRYKVIISSQLKLGVKIWGWSFTTIRPTFYAWFLFSLLLRCIVTFSFFLSLSRSVQNCSLIYILILLFFIIFLITITKQKIRFLKKKICMYISMTFVTNMIFIISQLLSKPLFFLFLFLSFLTCIHHYYYF